MRFFRTLLLIAIALPPALGLAQSVQTSDVSSLSKAAGCQGRNPNFGLSQAALNPPVSTIKMNNDGGWCWAQFAIHPYNAARPTAPETRITKSPAHGIAITGPVENGQHARLAYRPQPGFSGTDEFEISFQSITNGWLPMIVQVTVGQ